MASYRVTLSLSAEIDISADSEFAAGLAAIERYKSDSLDGFKVYRDTRVRVERIDE